jgi:hypothetical protein
MDVSYDMYQAARARLGSAAGYASTVSMKRYLMKRTDFDVIVHPLL